MVTIILTMPRHFIALNFPPTVRDGIIRAVAPLREAGFPFRWTPPDNLHITLSFLGDVDDHSLHSPNERSLDIVELLMELADSNPPFTLSLTRLGTFPTRNPRVLWVGVEECAALLDLHRRLTTPLATLGFEAEERPFRPHITVGRAARDARPRDFHGLDALLAKPFPPVDVNIRSIDLMRSRLTPEGARYEVDERFELTGWGQEPGDAPSGS